MDLGIYSNINYIKYNIEIGDFSWRGTGLCDPEKENVISKSLGTLSMLRVFVYDSDLDI